MGTEVEELERESETLRRRPVYCVPIPAPIFLWFRLRRPRQQLFVAETPAVVQERSAKIRAAEAAAQASEERRRNATGAKRLADPSATGPPRL